MNKTNTYAYAYLKAHTQPDLIDFPKLEDTYAYAIDVTRTPFQVMDAVSLSSPECSADYIYSLGLADHPQEHFVVLHLDTKNKILGHTIVTKGLVDRSHVHPREVFRTAILNGSSKVILAHNHPSGDVSPSRQDLDSTENLVKAGKIIGIPVIDHLIVGYCRDINRRHYRSLRADDCGCFKEVA